MSDSLTCVCSLKCACPASPNHARAKALKQTLNQVQKEADRSKAEAKKRKLEIEAELIMSHCEAAAKKGDDFITFKNPNPKVFKFLKKYYFVQLESLELRERGIYFHPATWEEKLPQIWKFNPLVM